MTVPERKGLMSSPFEARIPAVFVPVTDLKRSFG
jgi:hypothetical protein